MAYFMRSQVSADLNAQLVTPDQCHFSRDEKADAAAPKFMDTSKWAKWKGLPKMEDGSGMKDTSKWEDGAPFSSFNMRAPQLSYQVRACGS